MLRQAVLLCLLLAGMAKAQKALGQLSGNLMDGRFFPADTVLTDFQQDATFRGFVNENGRLNVTQEGFYYIYAQVFFEPPASSPTYHNRVALFVNGNKFSLMQTGLGGNGNDHGSVYTGGVTKLNVGDIISLKTVYESRILLTRSNTFFGAYRVAV